MLKQLKTYWPVLIIAALMIAALDATVSSLLTCHPVANHNHQAIDTQKQNECTAAAGPVLVTLQAIIDFLDGHGEAITAVFTLVLAAFTGTLWWSTNNLWVAAKIQESNTRILQRAYVAVIPHEISQYHQAGNAGDDNIACVVGFKNVGHLPARKVAYAIRHVFSVDPTLAQFAPLAGCCEGNVVLPAGIEMKKGSAPPVTRSEFIKNRDAATPQSGWLYVFGRVEYIDGFANPRWTEFCFRYSLAAANSGLNISKEAARYHEYGNHTDED